jgi:hypothetical protein
MPVEILYDVPASHESDSRLGSGVSSTIGRAAAGRKCAAISRRTEIENEQATGTYLAWNDMSLRLGGLFDILGGWTPDHDTHRVGKSVDINRRRFSVASPGTDVLPKIDDGTPAGTQLRKQLGQICAQNGGQLLSADPNLHCEYR